MKKGNPFALLLCLVLLFQCLALPAAAAETTEDPFGQEEPAPVDAPIPADNKQPFGTVCIQNGCRTVNGMVPLGGTDQILDSAQASFLYETTTGTVVYSYNADVKLAPGNLTKMVTSLIALEMCGIDDKITIETNNISKLPGGVQHQDLKNGETITVGDLVHMMLMAGANDAAIVIAEHIAGTQQAFVTLMNNRVKQMGCTNTEFGNVHGLTMTGGECVTTARDMVKITQEALKNEQFAEIFKVPKYTVPATEKHDARTFSTNNYMIDQSVIPDFYDKRVTGGIQHYIVNTGAHLVVTASSKNMDYIAVVLGAVRIMEANGWQPKIHGNFNEMAKLLKFGFDKYKVNHILYEGMSLKQFPVVGGESNAVGQSFVNYNSVVPISASMDNLNIRYSITDGTLTAPIAKNQQIGTLEIWYRNSCMAETEVFSMGEVRAVKTSGVNVRSKAARTDSDDSGILSVIGTICVIVLGLAVAYLGFNAYMRSRIRAQRRRRREARRRNY